MNMFDKLVSLLRGDDTAAPDGPGDKPDGLQLAVAALLVEAAWRDDVFETVERDKIEEILSDHFGLTAAQTTDLLAAVAKNRSNQLFGFTSKIVKAMDEEGRIRLIEMLWEVAYADGVLDADEDALIRRVAGLVYVTDVDRGKARRRVRDKLGLA